jgi:DNA-binding LacI/PurR family transcriptional regulator
LIVLNTYATSLDIFPELEKRFFRTGAYIDTSYDGCLFQIEVAMTVVRRPVTAHEVAALAGVSQSAVSRTFTKGASVSAKTREKVEKAAASLGYRPNMVARSLITRRSELIAVVVPSMANPFYSAMLEALSIAFIGVGYRILLFSTALDENSDPILEEVLRSRADAVVLVSASLSSKFADECHSIKLPVVLLNRRNASTSVSSVTSDNRLGTRTIAAFLQAGGHSRLAFMAGQDTSSTSHDRQRAFSEALAEAGMPAPQVEYGFYTFDDAVNATRRLLQQTERPDAIFCANDIMALGAINVARHEFKLEVGRELSIVGFDNIALASWPEHALTTYVQPIERMVKRAVSIICAQLQDHGAPAIQEELAGRLIVRSSARVPAEGVVEDNGERVWRPS